jgi:chromosome segregation ATPase
MLFGNKLKQLASASGKEKLTAEEIASINLELEDNGITAVSVVDRSEENATNVADLNAQLEAANAATTAAQTLVTSLTAERDALKAELEGAAEKRTSVAKDKDKGAEGKHPEWNDPNADYNQRARAATGK